jgi:hypothetical protein
MNETLERFLFAMVAGIVTAFVIEVVIKNFWRKVVRPWYENTVYRDAEIEGRWEARAIIDGQEVKRVWKIRRQGHEIKADVTSTGGYDEGETFRMTGTFKNLLLTGSYNPTDPSRTDRGTYTLQLVGDGQRFKGVIAYYSRKNGKVSSGAYELTRTNSESRVLRREEPEQNDKQLHPPTDA